MNYDSLLQNDKIEFGEVPAGAFMLGLLSTLSNRFQTVGDSFFKDITWKQYYVITCISFFKEAPTINDLSELCGSSHQNIKQILLKLEKKGYVELVQDKEDRRKQRIILTDCCSEYCVRNRYESQLHLDEVYKEISEEQLEITIQTILQMTKNLKDI